MHTSDAYKNILCESYTITTTQGLRPYIQTMAFKAMHACPRPGNTHKRDNMLLFQ
jgi:hypothetical protein